MKIHNLLKKSKGSDELAYTFISWLVRGVHGEIRRDITYQNIIIIDIFIKLKCLYSDGNHGMSPSSSQSSSMSFIMPFSNGNDNDNDNSDHHDNNSDHSSRSITIIFVTKRLGRSCELMLKDCESLTKNNSGD